jgi:hypothetical protein
MESKVQVAGSLNTPAYEWPLRAGITLCALAPVSYGLRLARWRGFGRFRGIFAVLRWIGPARFLGLGVVGLLLALAVRRARVARRRDLEIAPGRFALIDRRGRREFEDGEVVSVGFRPRSAPAGTVSTQRGRASLWVDGRDGPDRLDLDWEYPEVGGDPMAGFLGRIADRLHARAVKAIDSGSTVDGQGWELSRSGLQVGEAFEVIPFASIAQAEYHDGKLLIWRSGEVEPAVRVAEGSRNDAILHAILVERIPARAKSPGLLEPTAPGLGRLLFERRPMLTDRVGLWILTVILASSLVGFGWIGIRLGKRPALGAVVVGLGLLSFLPALIRQRAAFRFHERGVVRSGLFGVRELPFEDLAEVGVRALSGQTRFRVAFRPIPGRGRKPVALDLQTTDEAMETLRAYVPGGLIAG